MSDRKNTGDFYSEARVRVLEALRDRGPLTVPELPRGWPITRAFVTVLAEQIEHSGLAEWATGGRIPGKPALRITDAGRAWLMEQGKSDDSAVQARIRPDTPRPGGPAPTPRRSLAAD